MVSEKGTKLISSNNRYALDAGGNGTELRV